MNRGANTCKRCRTVKVIPSKDIQKQFLLLQERIHSELSTFQELLVKSVITDVSFYSFFSSSYILCFK